MSDKKSQDFKPIEISPRGVENLIRKWYRHDGAGKGTFICRNRRGNYTAIDNRTGDMWVEGFKTKRACRKWLKEDVEGLDD